MNKNEPCKYCGSSRHKSENCSINQWANYLTGESDTAPEGRTLLVTDEDNLVDAVEEVHALKHIKPLKSKVTEAKP